MPALVIRSPTRPRGRGVAVAMAGLTTALAGMVATADELDPTGGLRSRAPAAVDPALPGASREELVRRWDLDGNGTIDPSEASIARARMRRARSELEQSNGIDPLTGKPRVLAGNATPEPEPPMAAARASAEPLAPATESQPPAGPPGTRVPAVSGTTPVQPPATPRPSAIALPQAGGSRPPAVTGGVRAGAPAARAGYGSLAPATTLNAGRPMPSAAPPLAPGRGRRGGLVPSVPGRGAIGRPAMPAPPPLAPPSTPRITADEIGGF